MAFVDLKMKKTSAGYYDLTPVDGQFETTQGFDTAILMSFFCEKRADASEVADPKRRRGWWGNLFLGFGDFQIGSKLWLLEQARATLRTENNARAYAIDAYQWFIDFNYITKLEVTAEYNDEYELIIIIKFFISQNKVAEKSFKLWENTFEELEAEI